MSSRSRFDELRALMRGEFEAVLSERTPAQAPSPLKDKRGCAHALGISPATMTRLTAEGMPCIYVGKSPRYALDDVRRWLEARGQRGTNAATPSAGAALPAGVRLLTRRR